MSSPSAPFDKNRGSASRQHTLTLGCALLTLVLALLATIGSSRLHTLALNGQAASRAATVANAAEFQAATASLQTLEAELEAARQARDAAQGEAKRLRQQHAVAVKALEVSKVDLARANQTITDLKTALPVESSILPIPLIPLVPETPAFDGDDSASDKLTFQSLSDTRRAVQ